MKKADWTAAALQQLRTSRSGNGWGYRPDDVPYVEPSVLAGFVLRTWYGDARHSPAAATGVSHWLGSLVQDDGAIGLSSQLARPGWSTAWAIWYWRSGPQAPPAQCPAATRWLLRRVGETFPVPRNVGHDTTIPGWPWVEGTHSWVEPTAIAVQALCVSGLRDHPRTRDGVRLLLNRPVPSGGWNMGNRITKGTPLRAQCAPTGIALLALASSLTARQRSDARVRATIEGAIGFLLDNLPQTRAPRSLGWGLLGLAAWGVHPNEADFWLSEASVKGLDRNIGPVALALLLLAGRADRSLRSMRVPTHTLPPVLSPAGALP